MNAQNTSTKSNRWQCGPKPSSKNRVPAATALFVCFALLSCGGSTTTENKAAFLAKAQRICRPVRSSHPAAELEKIERAPPGEGETRFAQTRARTARRLASLHPLSEIRVGYERLVALIALEATLRRRVAAYEKDRRIDLFLPLLKELYRNNETVSKQALGLELGECSGPLEVPVPGDARSR
jgi:hypothetical protein